MLTISVWPRRLKEFLLTHPLYKSPIRHEFISRNFVRRSLFTHAMRFYYNRNLIVKPQTKPAEPINVLQVEISVI